MSKACSVRRGSDVHISRTFDLTRMICSDILIAEGIHLYEIKGEEWNDDGWADKTSH